MGVVSTHKALHFATRTQVQTSHHRRPPIAGNYTSRNRRWGEKRQRVVYSVRPVCGTLRQRAPRDQAVQLSVIWSAVKRLGGGDFNDADDLERC